MWADGATYLRVDLVFLIIVYLWSNSLVNDMIAIIVNRSTYSLAPTYSLIYEQQAHREYQIWRYRIVMKKQNLMWIPS
jgi:hypothetical protein